MDGSTQFHPRLSRLHRSRSANTPVPSLGFRPETARPHDCSFRHMHGPVKRIVYIIRSDSDPTKHYTGITNDLPGRIDWHNHGQRGHTTAGRPWSLLVSLEFSTERTAYRFERYLKSGSGRAFAKRHFAPEVTSKATTCVAATGAEGGRQSRKPSATKRGPHIPRLTARVDEARQGIRTGRRACLDQARQGTQTGGRACLDQAPKGIQAGRTASLDEARQGIQSGRSRELFETNYSLMRVAQCAA